MQPRIIFALIAVAFGLQSASATEIGLDYVLIGNPEPITGDGFDDGVFDAPPWLVLAGTPGPEAGGKLTLNNGDFIALALTPNTQADFLALSFMQLTDFPAGSVASMMLFGDQDGEMLSLGVLPGLGVLTDGTGSILGFAGLPPSSTATLLLTVDPFGHVTASVNDVPVYDQFLTFGPVTAIGFSVVPEPATLGLLGLGCVFMGIRRRMRRAHG